MTDPMNGGPESQFSGEPVIMSSFKEALEMVKLSIFKYLLEK